jgi:hypothetical protein
VVFLPFTRLSLPLNADGGEYALRAVDVNISHRTLEELSAHWQLKLAKWACYHHHLPEHVSVAHVYTIRNEYILDSICHLFGQVHVGGVPDVADPAG